MDHVHKTIDSAKLDAVVGRAIADISAGYGGVMISIGNKLGLYKAMADSGPLTSREIARRAGCAERYVREWLGSQVAGGYVAYHAISDTYELTPEQAMVLANEDSPVFIPNAWAVPASMWADEDKAIEAFRTGAGIAWGDHDGRLFCGVAAFYRNGYKASLVPEWLPALDGVVDKLKAGAIVADIGCGHGHSTVLMAGAFPNSKFRGFDTHGESVVEAGVTDRTTFAMASAENYPGTGYDLICFFDCLHDMGDPLAAAEHAARSIAKDGTVMLVAQAGEARLADIFRKAGFTRFRRAFATPFNLILEARL